MTHFYLGGIEVALNETILGIQNASLAAYGRQALSKAFNQEEKCESIALIEKIIQNVE